MAGLARNKAGLHAFVAQKVQDEIANRVDPDRSEQCAIEPQPVRADADVRGRAANIRGKAGDIDKRRTNIIAIQVDRRAAHVEGIILLCYSTLSSSRIQESGVRIQEILCSHCTSMDVQCYSGY